MIPTIDVRDLLGQPGSSKQHRAESYADGLGIELARVRDDVPIECDLLLEALVEGILVSGALKGTLSLWCARCLTEFERSFAVELHELFVLEPEGDTDDYRLDPEGFLAPDQMVRDTIGVELPFSPLCRLDCRGLCPVCGGDRNLDQCPGHVEVDPRWASLQQLAPTLDEN